MTSLLLLLLSFQEAPKPACCEDGGVGRPWAAYDKGVAWRQDGKAWETAKAEKKLVLYFELAGDLDKLGCIAGAHAMRTVTFADDGVLRLLKEHFVCTWSNRMPKYHTCDTAVDDALIEAKAEAYPTSSVMTAVCTPDRRVLHYFTGYFSPTLFLAEMRLALRLSKTFEDNGELREDLFREMHGNAAGHRWQMRSYTSAVRGNVTDERWTERNSSAALEHLEDVNSEMSDGGPRALESVLKDRLTIQVQAPPVAGRVSTEVRLAPEKACCKGGVADAWSGYDKGIEWRQDGTAWETAKHRKKLVLYFELVGDLDKEGC